MKKRFIYIGILSIIFMICGRAFIVKNHNDNMPYKYPDGKTEFDFNKQNQPKASRILYKYILESENLTAKEAKKSNDITPNQVRAFEFDLNDDGVNEIIGTVNTVYYCGAIRNPIFILQNQNGKYENIIKYHICYNSPKVHINKDKTNGYNDITLFVADNEYSEQFIERYHNGFYYKDEDYTPLKEYIDNNYAQKMPIGTVEYNIPSQTSEKAKKILYEYLYKYLKDSLKMKVKDITEMINLKLDNVYAIEIDLNYDGVNEIIGYCDSGYFLNGAKGSEAKIFILKKNGSTYENIISEINNYFIAWNKFYVLPGKTNGYNDMIFYISTSKEPMPVFIRFYKNSYDIN